MLGDRDAEHRERRHVIAVRRPALSTLDLCEVLGRKSAAETACDRFALRNYRRREVTVEDAAQALRRT